MMMHHQHHQQSMSTHDHHHQQSSSLMATNHHQQTNNNEIKTQLICREGVYSVIQQAEYGRPKLSPYGPHSSQTGGGCGSGSVTGSNNPGSGTSNTNSSSLPLVRMSFTKFVAAGSFSGSHGQRIMMGGHRLSHEMVINGHMTSVSTTQRFNGTMNDNETNDLQQDIDDTDQPSIRSDNSNPHSHQQSSSTSTAQHHNLSQEHHLIQERICFNTARELFVNVFNGLQPSDPSKMIDRKTYKATSPTCHDFCTFVDQRISMLLIGFCHGQIQLIDQYRTDINKFYNQDRLIDKSKVTCIRWLPRSKSNFLVSYSSGQMYLYKEDLPCLSAAPTYQQYKSGEGFVIYTCKRSSRNPIFRWSIGVNANNNSSSSSGSGGPSWNSSSSSLSQSSSSGGNIGNSSAVSGFQSSAQSAINEFAFSPCGEYLAVVSQDGFLRVFHYDQMELIGRMRSYFGGLLCVGWSPDSKFLVTGGEDDLITVWSLQDKRVIARGQGHKSWVNSVTFDPYMTKTNGDHPSEEEDNDGEDYDLQTDNDSVIDGVVPFRRKRNDQFKMFTNYRIGSVGQDTQICLWDLTDDIIRQSTVIKSRSRSTISSAAPTNTPVTNFEFVTGKLSGTNQSTTTTTTTTSTTATTTTHHPHHHHNFFNSLKKGGHKKATGFLLSSRSFLDHGKKNHSGSNKNLNTNNDNSTTNTSMNDGNLSSTTAICDSSRLLGTVLCPRLKEVPMLEPHVCKKISHERLTSLVFRKDSLIVANHDGKIMVFARPNQSDNSNLKISSPNTSMASDVNEIAQPSGNGQQTDDEGVNSNNKYVSMFYNNNSSSTMTKSASTVSPSSHPGQA